MVIGWELVSLSELMIKYLSDTAAICQDDYCQKSVVKCTNLETVKFWRNCASPSGDITSS